MVCHTWKAAAVLTAARRTATMSAGASAAAIGEQLIDFTVEEIKSNIKLVKSWDAFSNIIKATSKKERRVTEKQGKA